MPGGAPEVLGGPLWWYFVGVYLLAIGLAAFVLVESLRTQRRERLAELPESERLYPIAAGVFLVCVVGVWIPIVPRPVSVVPIVLAPFALVLGVAYLLRIVFPKPTAIARDDAPGTEVDRGEVLDSMAEDSEPGAPPAHTRNTGETQRRYRP